MADDPGHGPGNEPGNGHGGRGAALDGLRVLVTRPRHQSAGLARLIEARGGTALLFPVIELVPPRDPQVAQALLACAEQFAAVIFVSPNAVTHGLALLDAAGAGFGRARLVAVGESSARALEQAGFDAVLRPDRGASSEALLALPEFAATALDGRRILIVRGEGGRELLGDTLSQRGARVTYAEVYRRALPRRDAAGRGLAERGARGGIDTIVITSAQGLDNLFALLGEQAAPWLKETGYVVASDRLADHAQALGISERPVVAAGADDDALLAALIRWREVYSHAGS